ncbi:FtsQ-type POTRA domain-containing protein [Arthrobacter sp. B3I4]|uniref:FtsQ-type POTRA domain-containing protein n=1 Tax=Arthrobacter sp. B3I4 TaxID=3042267 RepID=UPI002780BF5E|nr:FtsQ-type POTRA domain-containing protein [Arthrobacter sp. B3I4]MDQ0756793.1 cell division protein FtsQ [Arthrobacter sp. B3I4]
MPSTRRPSYTPGPRGTGSGPASGRPSGGQPDVISASKSDSAASPAAGAAHSGATALGAGSPGRGNVLSFPEPKAKRRRRIVLSTVAVIAVVVAGILAAAVYSPWLAVRTVSVEGTRLLSTDQVTAALAPLQGKPLPQVSDEDVRALLQPLVQVKAVTSQARPPSTLQVHVIERVPVALLKQGASFQLVDPDGVQLGTTADPATVKLPVIDSGGGALPQELFHAITGVLGALPPDVLARLSDASAKSVDAVELRLVDGQTIVWGNAGEKELKARVLAALLKAPADPKNPVRTYDVSAPRHPVTRQ